MAGVWARGASQKIWDPLLIYATQNRFETSLPLKLATLNLVYNLGLGLSYQKNVRTKNGGGGLGQGASEKKFGTPYLFLQPLKLATEKLVHSMSSGLACQTQVLGPMDKIL